MLSKILKAIEIVNYSATSANLNFNNKLSVDKQVVYSRFCFINLNIMIFYILNCWNLQFLKIFCAVRSLAFDKLMKLKMSQFKVLECFCEQIGEQIIKFNWSLKTPWFCFRSDILFRKLMRSAPKLSCKFCAVGDWRPPE